MDTRIFIVDDSPAVRTRLKTLLQDHAGWKVCWEASDGEDALERVKEARPDVIVMDFSMPRMDGLEATRRLSKIAPEIPILMFTMHTSPWLEAEARRAGARGVVAKSDVSRMVEGLETVLRSEQFFYFPAPPNSATSNPA